MPRLSLRTPKYCLHRATGQAVVTINGRDIYLGKHGSDASREQYDRLIAEFVATRRTSQDGSATQAETVCELTLAFWEDREGYYVKNGKPTSEDSAFRAVIRRLNQLYASTPIDDFGPLALKALRQTWVDQDLARLTCNRNLRKVVEVFRWGVENELVRHETWQSLRAVKGLKKGRTKAAESVPVPPVELERVEATMPHLSPVVRDMIRMQLLTGARPGEVCKIRPRDIDRREAVWIFTPESHKTQHHGRSREVYIGPEGQAILRPYLLRPADSHCFSAAESREWFREQAADDRVTPDRYGNARGRKLDKSCGPGTHQPRNYFDSHAYGHAIARGCRKAWPAPKSIRDDAVAVKAWDDAHRWAPNQLRHTRGTKVRQLYGLEAAQVILGHAKADVTQIYAERDKQLAMRVAGESG